MKQFKYEVVVVPFGRIEKSTNVAYVSAAEAIAAAESMPDTQHPGCAILVRSMFNGLLQLVKVTPAAAVVDPAFVMDPQSGMSVTYDEAMRMLTVAKLAYMRKPTAACARRMTSWENNIESARRKAQEDTK